MLVIPRVTDSLCFNLIVLQRLRVLSLMLVIRRVADSLCFNLIVLQRLRVLFLTLVIPRCVTVTVPVTVPVDIAPTFTRPLTDVTANDGEQVTLACEVKALPDPEVQYFRSICVRGHSSVM